MNGVSIETAAAAFPVASTMCPPALVLAHEQARDELRRVDAKATTLLSLAGVAVAGVVALTARPMPVPAVVLVWLAAVGFTVVVLVLLDTIRPRGLRPVAAPGSWLHAARSTPAELLAAVTDLPDSGGEAQRLAAHVCQLARLALVKYQRLALAVTLLAGATVLLLAALALTVVTR